MVGSGDWGNGFGPFHLVRGCIIVEINVNVNFSQAADMGAIMSTLQDLRNTQGSTAEAVVGLGVALEGLGRYLTQTLDALVQSNENAVTEQDVVQARVIGDAIRDFGAQITQMASSPDNDLPAPEDTSPLEELPQVEDLPEPQAVTQEVSESGPSLEQRANTEVRTDVSVPPVEESSTSPVDPSVATGVDNADGESAV